jgi:hypothetical protein
MGMERGDLPDMEFRYDEKGKIYTDIVQKVAVPSTIQTLTHRIHGQVYVSSGTRLKDELDKNDVFLAITGAIVLGDDGQVIYRADFMVVKLDHIVWLIPDDEFSQDQATSGAK